MASHDNLSLRVEQAASVPLLLVIAAAAACASGLPPAPVKSAPAAAPTSSAAPTSPAAPSYRVPPPCRNAEDCAAAGKAALAADDADARALLTLACDRGNAEGCLELGKACATGKGGAVDRDAARAAFGTICRGKGRDCDILRPTRVTAATCVADACAWLADLSSEDPERLLYAERGCSTQGQQDPKDRAVRSRACIVAATNQDAKGRGPAARESYRTACSLGSDEGCQDVLGKKSPAP